MENFHFLIYYYSDLSWPFFVSWVLIFVLFVILGPYFWKLKIFLKKMPMTT